MNNIALLALEASDGAVVLTSISLVFGMLVALCLIITIEGKIFDAKNGTNKKNKPSAPAKTAPAPAAAPTNVAKAATPAPAPAVEGGIPGEIVAAIAAAVATMGGNLSIRGIHRKQGGAAKTGHRRGAWGNAGVHENTTPFM